MFNFIVTQAGASMPRGTAEICSMRTDDDDLPMPDAATCMAVAANFIGLTKQLNRTSYSFWCWDSAPEEIWEFFASTAV